jgi:hypothetical protein
MFLRSSLFTSLAFAMTFIFGSVLSAAPIPFSGKISINGANFDGTAQFTFALRDANGTIHWRNGANANTSIEVSVDRGHYIVLLGGQAMTPVDEQLFLNHSELYLQVRFYRADTTTMAALAARPAHHLDPPRPYRRTG